MLFKLFTRALVTDRTRVVSARFIIACELTGLGIANYVYAHACIHVLAIVCEMCK